jgi:zinc/manganese transport system permease protein
MNDLAQNLSIVLPAMLAGLLVLSTHVPLGREVLKRGIIFLDIAIAQLAAFGVIIVHSIGAEDHQWLMQLVAVCCALGGALFLHLTEKHYPQLQEAIIGTVFVLAATGGFLLLSNNPHGHEHITDLLSGQILWVDYHQLIPLALVSAIVLLVWFRYPAVRYNLGFYILFAIAITSSVQLVGIYLVFSSLIIPALVVHKQRHALRWGYVVGVSGYVIGLIVSTLFDLPAGPAIVWSLAVIGLALNQLLIKFDATQTSTDTQK